MKAVLFDFFGTLAECQPDRARLGAPETHRRARSYGFEGDHDTFVAVWDRASGRLEQASRATLREFSMADAARAFGDAAQLRLTLDETNNLGRCYVEEWSRHVHPIPGVTELIRQLARTLAVAVVSNTHDPDLVPAMLRAMGVADEISTVVLSVEHGRLKPHPSIYSVALERVGCAAEDAVFVGDSLEADYIGPLDAGMRAFLIDPSNAHGVPTSARLTSVLDIVTRVGGR